MSFDPYEILGVGRSAGAAALKTAYRQRAQATHPDRGGDGEVFIAVVRAFAILSDPAARKLYDEGGVVDEAGVDGFRRDVATVLTDMFDAAVASAIATGLVLERVDFIAEMAGAVRTGLAEARSDLARSEREIAALGTLGRRIRRTGAGQNLFTQRLDAQVAAKHGQQAAIRRRVLLLDTALVELGNYASEVELIAALESTPPS